MTCLKCISNWFILVNWAGGKMHIISSGHNPRAQLYLIQLKLMK